VPVPGAHVPVADVPCGHGDPGGSGSEPRGLAGGSAN
jgi:hypothetical protein